MSIRVSVRPTMEQTLMSIASVMSKRSTCSRNQVGCVIALEGRILSTGYNGAPAGMKHCDHTCSCGGSNLTPEHHGVDCTSGTCLLSVHAESNAIAFAARYGIPLNGATAYTTVSPCIACAQLIINAGITGVAYNIPYRVSAGIELLFTAGIAVWTQDGS